MSYPRRAHPAGPVAVAAPYAVPRGERYWPHVVLLAVLMIGVVGARVHEVPLVYKIRPNLLLSLLVAPFAILGTSDAVRARVVREPVFRFMTAYFLWSALTAPFALWKGPVIQGVQGLFTAVMLVYVTLIVRPNAFDIERLQKGFVAGCVITAVNANVFGFMAGGRLSTMGTFDPNDLAGVMAMATPLALGLAVRARGAQSLAWLLAAVGMIATYTRTGSRGGMLALTVSTLVYVAGQRGSRRAVFLIVAVVGSLATYQFGPPTFRERISSFIRGEEDYNETAYAGRKMVWQRARGYTLDHPITGVGINNFPVAEGETCRRLFPGQGCKWSNTHNAYFQASAELGFPGAMMFIGLLLAGAKRAYQLWRPTPSRRADAVWHRPELLASVLGFVVSATFLSHAYFYLAFALCAMVTVAATARERALAAAAAPPEPVPDAAPWGVPALRGRFRMRGGLALRPSRAPYRGALDAQSATTPHGAR